MNIKHFKWPVRIYYEDTDAGGIVYHARYVAFYERARTEMLRQFEMQQGKMLSENVAFAVKRMTIDFMSPAYLDDLLEVRSKVIEMKKASILFEQEIMNSNGKLINRATVLIACVNPILMKPIAIPNSIVVELTRG